MTPEYFASRVGQILGRSLTADEEIMVRLEANKFINDSSSGAMLQVPMVTMLQMYRQLQRIEGILSSQRTVETECKIDELNILNATQAQEISRLKDDKRQLEANVNNGIREQGRQERTIESLKKESANQAFHLAQNQGAIESLYKELDEYKEKERQGITEIALENGGKLIIQRDIKETNLG